jgi:hypothetical protein
VNGTAPRAPARATPSKPAVSGGRGTAAGTKRGRASARSARGKGPAARKATRRAAAPATPPVRVIKLRELDPIAKCGPDTSVQQLIRVDELLDGRPTIHLVFFDRHGWYCVHGPGCVAVKDVHKELKERGHAARR